MKPYLLLALLAFVASNANANDFLKVLDSINKAVETTDDAGVQNVQASTGFANGAATGVGSIFPTGTKIVYISYTASGASTLLPIQSVWYQVKNGKDFKIYALNATMPKSGVVSEFHLGRKDNSWPLGDYRVDLVVQSKVLGSASFKIDDSQTSGNSGVWGSDAAAVQAPGVKDLLAATGFSGGKAVGAGSSFQQGVKTLYIVYTTTGQSSGVAVQAVWSKLDSTGVATKISAMNSTLPASGVSGEFHLSVSGASWPAGSYKVDLLINGAIAGTVNFKVEELSNAGVWQVNDAQSSTTSSPSSNSTAQQPGAVKQWGDPAPAQSQQPGEAQKALDDFFSK